MYHIHSTKSKLSRVLIIDVRKDFEYRGGHIIGAVNACWRTSEAPGLQLCLSKQVKQMASGAPIVFYDEFGGKRAQQACAEAMKTMHGKGHPCFVLTSGYSKLVKDYPQLCEPRGGHVAEGAWS